MVVYEKFLLAVRWIENSDWTFKKNLKFLIENHYKTIYEPVRSERSSCKVLQLDKFMVNVY